MKQIIWVIVVVVILGGFLWWGKSENTPPKTNEPIKVGVIESLTGSAAYYGEGNKNGVEIAVAEISKKYPDLQFNVYHEDSLYTPKGGVDAYNNLKGRYGLDAVITHASHVSLAVQPLAKADGIIQMGVSASAKGFSSPNDLSFRVSPNIDIEVKVMADFIKNKKYKKISVLYFNTDVGINVSNSIKTELAGSGSNISTDETFPLDSTDFRTYLTKIKQASPDAIYAIGTAAHLSNILKQANEIELKSQFLGFRATEDPTLTKNASTLAEGFIYTYAFDSNDKRKETTNFVEAYKAKYTSIPDGYAAEGYEGMMVLASAFNECGKDYVCIQKYLSGLKNYPSIFGLLSFDSNGDVSYPFFLKIVKNGQFVKLEN